ncbi:MAG: ribonuclease HI family protein [Patescibacteria group bacterium]|nr:ribonuclease HI family protein [Patescibacteria group bacterium]MDD5121753.1 ribonuclease HI family protein [Patescibacteria group bacterium]
MPIKKHKKIILYTDGGARNNPGPAGIGGVLYGENKETILEYAKYIGEATNNQAEYESLVFALEKAKKAGAEEVSCYLDSELVIKQVNQEYRVKDKDLAKLFIKVWNLSQSFKKISFHHIPREKNKIADRLVNQAIDKKIC